MKILAIETSCDETGVAVLEEKDGHIMVLGSELASQVEIHKEYGGVYPALARREHEKNLVPVLKKALKKAKMLKKSKIQISNTKSNPNDKFQTLEKILGRHKELYKNLKEFLVKYDEPEIGVIAVTIGPGLEPCLWTGVNFAKALAFWWNLQIIPVDHMEGHIFANFAGKRIKNKKLEIRNIFPAIVLLVSGGHTQLILMKGVGKYRILGETRDDAAGECFDKTARMLGLPYPGGPVIAAEAAKLQTTNYKLQTKLPSPMINSKDYDFSFSGLKTAVFYKIREADPKTRKSQSFVQVMSFEIQRAIVDVLAKKTIRAARDFMAKSIILGGGVAANERLRKVLGEKSQKHGLDFFVPPKKLCTDNAVIIGMTAFYHPENAQNWKKIFTCANLRIDE